MQPAPSQPNRNKLNLIVDIAIFLAFLIVMAPHFSGTSIHEWLGIAFGAALITHLLLHWQWIIGIGRRLFGKVQWSARLGYVLNLLLFIDMTIIIFTGIMISESALPALGIQLSGGFGWRHIHELAANLSVLIVGLHIAVHWNWIANMFYRFLIAPFRSRRAPRPGLTAQSQHKEA